MIFLSLRKSYGIVIDDHNALFEDKDKLQIRNEQVRDKQDNGYYRDTFNLKEMINIFQKRKKNIKIYNDQTRKVGKDHFWRNLR